MSIDTHLVVPARDPHGARSVLDPGESESTHVGADFLVLHLADAFSTVELDPARYGVDFAESVPPSLRKDLDPRGIAAYPEVGQSFRQWKTYAELIAAEEPLWLPTRRSPRKRRTIKTVKVLLVPLSPASEQGLVASPGLVKGLVRAHLETPRPDALEIEAWVELQRMFFDADAALGKIGPADVVVPTKGLPLYEDKTVDAARLVRVADVAARTEWLRALPADVLARARALPDRSEAAKAFPASLGTVPADDDDDPRPLERVVAIDAAQVERLVAFYATLEGKALLVVRYRS